MNNILKSKAKIRFQDCDPFNHLNNSKYIDYFINHREDQILEHYNLDVFKQIQTNGTSWLVTSNQIAYLQPARLMETVVMESKLINFTPKSLTVEMKMWNENEQKLKSIFWVTFMYFDIKTQKSSKHTTDLMALFEKIKMPIIQKTFEERTQHIIRLQKQSKL